MTEKSTLAELRWQHRLIIAFTDQDSAQYPLLSHWANTNSCKLTERDVLFLSVDDELVQSLTSDAIQLDDASVLSLRKLHNAEAGSFEMLLIGKDGGIKSRSSEVKDLDHFIDRIDGMPMRKREASLSRRSNPADAAPRCSG